MKEYDIFKAMNGTKEEYILQSEEFVKPKGTSGKAIKVVLAAVLIAAITAVPVGAVARSQLKNRESAKLYLGNTDLLEESGAVENQVMENEHVRITLDTVLSDGYTALAIVTLDALTEQGRNYINYKPDFILRRTDTGETMFHTGGGAMDDWEEQIKNDTIRYFHTIDLAGMDVSCEYEMIFYSMDLFTEEEWKAGVTKPLDENMIPEGNSLGYDFIAKVSLAKNTESVKMKSADGKTIRLSQFQVIDETGEVLRTVPDSVRLIRSSGSQEVLSRSGRFFSVSDDGGTHSTLFFGKLIDLKEYKGIIIDGVEYLK